MAKAIKAVKSAPKKAQEARSVVEPTISINGHSNPFKEQLDNDDVELVSVGYKRVNGTNTYSAYTIYTKGSEVTKIVVDEPNLKVIAEESAKISFVSNFVDADE